MPNGGWGVWQEDLRYDTYETTCGFGFAYVAVGRSIVFDIRNRLLGSWIKNEVYARDPSLWHLPANHYHQAFIASKAAERAREDRNRETRSSALDQWNVVKKNDALMNRISKKLTIGDTDGAVSELSVESLYRHARRENPREMRQKDYWKNVFNS